jgi:predicted amidohydrolase
MNDSSTTIIATVAMNSDMGEPETNLARVSYWCERAHKQGARFVLFTEECITGSLNKSNLSYQDAVRIAQDADKIVLPYLESLAARFAMTLVVGTIESVGDKLANSLIIVGPEGYLTTYRKLHLPNPTERAWFIEGDSLPVIRSQGWTFGVGLCYDGRFGELFRTAAQMGAEFYLLAVAASGGSHLVTPEGDQDQQALMHRELMMQFMPARAVDNGMYVCYANQSGRSGNAWFPGLCLVCDPNGQLIAEHYSNEDMVVVELSRDLVEKARSGSCAMNEIRPEIYANPVLVKS